MTDETTYADVVEEMQTTNDTVLQAIETLERSQRGLCCYQLQLFEGFLASYEQNRPVFEALNR